MNPQESATDRELDQFYGKTETEAGFRETVLRQKAAIDDDDLQDIAFAKSAAILDALRCGDSAEIGNIFKDAITQMIAGRVSYELYGVVGKISAKDVQ